MAVLTTGRVVAPQEGIVDMTGPGADYTPFSKTCNLTISLSPVAETEPHQCEQARRAGLRAAHYLAAACKGATADKVETFDFPAFSESMHAHPGLPKVAYIYMLQSQGLLHDTWVYGVDAKRILPTMISPTEIMDGAIISGNCVCLRQEQHLRPPEQPRDQKPLCASRQGTQLRGRHHHQ